MRIISKSVLMLCTKNYQNESMLVETIQLAKVGAFLDTVVACIRRMLYTSPPVHSPSDIFPSHISHTRKICLPT